MIELYYWPGIPGRGEYIRLALEDAGADYRDLGREAGIEPITALLRDRHVAASPFAPPFARVDGRLVSHVARILQVLGPRLGLAPADDAQHSFVDDLQLTITDFVGEIHDTHHPLGPELHYEEQGDEAKRRSALFRAHRLPKYLGYFEEIIAGDPEHPWLVGDAATTADLSLFHTIAGLRHALPKAMADIETAIPAVIALHDAVAARPAVATYLASDRRQAFNQDGVFRRYPELDGTAGDDGA